MSLLEAAYGESCSMILLICFKDAVTDLKERCLHRLKFNSLLKIGAHFLTKTTFLGSKRRIDHLYVINFQSQKIYHIY